MPTALTRINNLRITESRSALRLKGLQFVDIIGTNFEQPTSVEIFYNGNKIATLGPSSTFPPMVYNPNRVTIDFDFQGNEGNYGIDVVREADNSRSALFNFTVVAP